MSQKRRLNFPPNNPYINVNVAVVLFATLPMAKKNGGYSNKDFEGELFILVYSFLAFFARLLKNVYDPLIYVLVYEALMLI